MLRATGEAGQGVLTTHLHADGRYSDKLTVPKPSPIENPRINQAMLDKGEFYPVMEGRYVFKHAVTRFPEVINEALAAGIPVIASAVGGIPAYLHHGTTGLLVPPGDRIALSEALTTILKDPVLRQRLARQGQALMRNNTLEANRDRIVAVVKREVFHELESAPSVGTL